jgi:hypothetical protein
MNYSNSKQLYSKILILNNTQRLASSRSADLAVVLY